MYKIFITLLLSSLLISCSEEVYEYEEMVRQELKTTHQTMTEVEIKKWAGYLSKWSEPDFYRKEIEEFKKTDSNNFPKKNTILFIGSSSIVYWNNLKKDMFPHEVINRGFGGAHIAHINNHFEEIVIPYKPKGIVFYCGSNDLAALKSPKEVFYDFLIFFQNVSASLPKTKIFVIGIKPSIARYHLREKQLIVNKLTSNLAKEEESLVYVDVWDNMLLKNGKADPNLFVEDGLHMNENGYQIWKNLVKPYLTSNFESDKS